MLVFGIAFFSGPHIAFSAATEAGKLGSSEKSLSPDEIARGRYMVVTGHCNNCHTSDYAGKQGNIPEKDWLMGSPIGYRGPWGTTYPINLRLFVSNFTEDQWVAYAKAAKPRPPMPWWSVHETSEQDLRAMYKFIKHLGPAGKPAKQYVPPDKKPAPPYIQYPAGPR